MGNSSSLVRKPILFCLGASLLALSGMLLNCKRPHPKITVTITGSDYTPSQTPPNESLSRDKHDVLEWRNKSNTDMLVCMVEIPPVGAPNPDDRAFVPTYFYIPMGESVFSGPVRTNAKKSSTGYTHTYAFVSDTSGSPADDCSRGSKSKLPPPKPIDVE